MDEKRLIDLETKISYQEILIEELQKTVLEQYLILEKNIKEITQRMNADADPANSTHEKPPHY